MQNPLTSTLWYEYSSLANCIEQHVKGAHRFVELVRGDSRFEVVNQAMGLVYFRVNVFSFLILIAD